MADVRIVQCINDIGEFDPIEFNNLKLGIEIHDFAFTELLDGDWQTRVGSYQKKLVHFNNIISMHGAALDLNPASPDKMIVEVTNDRYLRSIEIAKSLNASFLIFHSQINPGIKVLAIKEIKINRQLAFWQNILEEINQSNIILLLENVFESDSRDLLTLVQRIGSPRIKVCLDVGHIHVHSPMKVEDWIKDLLPYIEYIHLHWNNGKYDEHKPPDENTLNRLAGILKANNLNPIISLEYEINEIKSEIQRLRDLIE